jgi:hypothetical protein
MFPNNTRQVIEEAAPHANINFVEISGKAEHLVGTQWKNPWYSAQPRFLPAVYHLWKSNPNVRWYVVGDDDTYLYPLNIIRRVGKHNSSEPEVISFFWCTWNQITDYMMPERECHPFAQGGSGVLFSKTIMDMIGPHLLECGEKYNDAEHAASMRISCCMERHFGYENWTKGGYIKPWKSGFHPSSPSVTVTFGNTWDAPGSFHQVSPVEMLVLKRGHTADVEDGFYDFSRVAFRSLPVELTRGTYWQFHFGFAFDLLATHSNRIESLTQIRTDDGGKTFTQSYGGGVKVVVNCDEEVPLDVIDVDDVRRGPNTTVYLRMLCPEKTKYYKA